MKSAAKFLSGSLMTYVLMAACSSTTSAPSAPSSAGQAQNLAGGTTGAAGAMASAGSSVGGSSAGAGHVGGMLGMIMDPVPDASAEPATDGSRLKAEYNIGADGSRQFVGWWDSMRNEECNFLPFADGVTRCVPAPTASLAVFSDSGCSIPLYGALTAGCTTAKYAVPFAATGTCLGYGYTSVVALAPATPAKIFGGTPAACNDVSAAYGTAYSFYSATSVPLSSFVTGTKQHP